MADRVEELAKAKAMTARLVSRARNSELKIAISRFGPVCPHCGEDGFDDWWLEHGLIRSFGIVALTGSLKCHGCGKFFHIDQYADNGECHCTAQTRIKRGGAP